MKIQVCRNCGNRNTVVSRALTSCNYCGSEDLEPITDTNNPNSAIITSGGSSSKGKWVFLLLLVLLIGGGAFWSLQFSSTDLGFKNSKAVPAAQIVVKPIIPNHSTQVEPEQAISQPETEDKKGSNPQKEEANDVVDKLVETERNKAVSVEKESKAIVVKPENLVKNKVEGVQAESAKEVVPEPNVALKPTAKTTPQVKLEAKNEMSTPVKRPIEKSVTKPKQAVVAKVSESKNQLSDDAKTIAELKRKLQEYKTEVAQKTEQKNAKETRLSMRVLDRQKGIVTDAKTGLMWMACSIGQEWANGSCVGSAEEYLWTEAADLARDAGFAGYNDWRLPTREELNSIVYCSNGRLGYQLGSDGKMRVKDGEPQNGKCLGKFQQPTIDKRVFPNASGSTYWSYSRNAQATYNAWAVFFNGGYQYSYNTTNLGLVRLVRNSR